MKFARGKQLKRIAFTKLVLLVLVSFMQQAFTAVPQPNALYAAIWHGGEASLPIPVAALACYTDVVGLPGRIENTTKHVLKHMTFPRERGQTVPRQLLCWVVPEGADGKRNAEAALIILTDLYKTGLAIGNIQRLVATVENHTAEVTEEFHSAIDAIVAYADAIKNKFGFPVNYEYVADTPPEWVALAAVLSPYELALRDNEAVRRFIGRWHSGRPDKYENIQDKLDIQAAYFTAVEQTMPEIMACFQYCVRRICGSVFTVVGDITRIAPPARPAGLLPPTPTTLYRRFNARIAGDHPVDGQYAVFAKTVSGGAVPDHTVSIDHEVQAMTNNTLLAHIRVAIGHELREGPHAQYYETDIRTMFIASGYPK